MATCRDCMTELNPGARKCHACGSAQWFDLQGAFWIALAVAAVVLTIAMFVI